MLDAARRAARWIQSTRIETADGITWPPKPASPERHGPSLYYGAPGVVLFHLELFHATGDKEWLDEARAGADQMIAGLADLRASRGAGFYTGVAGSAFVLEEVRRATGENRYREAAQRAVSWIHQDAAVLDGGAGWPGRADAPKESAVNDIISGSAGIGLLLLWVHRRAGDPDSRRLAAEAGRLLVERGRPAGDGGLKWDYAPGAERLYPNFSHGTAGIAYFLATLYEATGDREFLEAAQRGAVYLQSVAAPDREGFNIFHHTPGGRDLFYLGWCHGPVGTSRLFYRLAEMTGDEHWMDLTQRSARALLESGIPEQRTPGFWNNVGQCGGNAGVGEYFAALYRSLPDGDGDGDVQQDKRAYRHMAKRVGEDTLQRAAKTDGDGLKWVHAEHRTMTDHLLAQTGFMQGAAGVGTFLLHLDALDNDHPLPIKWPDSPFT